MKHTKPSCVCFALKQPIYYSAKAEIPIKIIFIAASRTQTAPVNDEKFVGEANQAN